MESDAFTSQYFGLKLVQFLIHIVLENFMTTSTKQFHFCKVAAASHSQMRSDNKMSSKTCWPSFEKNF